MVRMGSERSSPGRKAFDLKEALDVFGARGAMLIWCLMDGKRGKLYQTPECFDR
ncbi:unnamed protein product, partial [Musa acuminata var. zebrina]